MRVTILYIFSILLIIIGLFALSFTLVTYRRYETEAQHWEDEANIYYEDLVDDQQSHLVDGEEATAQSYANAIHNATIADSKADQCIWGFAGAGFIMASGLAILIFIWKYEKEKEIQELISSNKLKKET